MNSDQVELVGDANPVDRATNFLYHLGKGLWKSVPLLGPIVEEVFYEQFRSELTSRAAALSPQDLEQIVSAIPQVDLELVEEHLGASSEREVGEFGANDGYAIVTLESSDASFREAR